MAISDIAWKMRGVALSLPSEAGKKVGKVVLSSIDTAIEHRWAEAQARAARMEGASIDDKVSALTQMFAKELATVGLVTGGAAAVPAFGTGVAVSTGLAEFGWFTVRASELILTIGALHGHTESTVDEMRAWILSILIFGNGATEGFTKLAGELGKGLGKKAVTNIPMSAIRAINSAMGRTIITKYGTKRGVIALGTALPLGIGAAVGGTANYATVVLLGRHANKFFKNLPYRTVVTATSFAASA